MTEEAENGNEVGSLTVKLPDFNTDDPELWFQIIEAQFILCRITVDHTKFFTVVAKLDQRITKDVRDIVMKPPDDGKYEALKKALISRACESGESKMRKLFGTLDIGDQKPSRLLREMQTLNDGTVNDDGLKWLWMKRLPRNVQAVLSISSESLDKLALLADTVASTYASSGIEVINTSENEDLKGQIEALRKEFREFDRNRSSSRERTTSRPRSPSTTRGKERAGICFYHRKFGKRANPVLSSI